MALFRNIVVFCSLTLCSTLISCAIAPVTDNVCPQERVYYLINTPEGPKWTVLDKGELDRMRDEGYCITEEEYQRLREEYLKREHGF